MRYGTICFISHLPLVHPFTPNCGHKLAHWNICFFNSAASICIPATLLLALWFRVIWLLFKPSYIKFAVIKLMVLETLHRMLSRSPFARHSGLKSRSGTGYRARILSWFLSVRPAKFRNNTWHKYITAAFSPYYFEFYNSSLYKRSIFH